MQASNYYEENVFALLILSGTGELPLAQACGWLNWGWLFLHEVFPHLQKLSYTNKFIRRGHIVISCRKSFNSHWASLLVISWDAAFGNHPKLFGYTRVTIFCFLITYTSESLLLTQGFFSDHSNNWSRRSWSACYSEMCTCMHNSTMLIIYQTAFIPLLWVWHQSCEHFKNYLQYRKIVHIGYSPPFILLDCLC